jgi:hypothetical protein
MRLFHTISKTWYKVLHQHTMYVISLSNISTKTNFKQITRIELNLPNLYNTLMGLHVVHDITLVYFLITFSVTIQSSDNAFLEKCGPYSCWKYWNIKQSLCLRCLHWCVLPRIPMIWHHDKVVRQRKSHATSHHLFITTVWWYNILYQTPVHNVR